MRLLPAAMTLCALAACDESPGAGTSTDELVFNASWDEAREGWVRKEPGNASRVVVSSNGYNFQYRAKDGASPWAKNDWLTAALIPSDGDSPVMIDRLQVWQSILVDNHIEVSGHISVEESTNEPAPNGIYSNNLRASGEVTVIGGSGSAGALSVGARGFGYTAALIGEDVRITLTHPITDGLSVTLGVSDQSFGNGVTYLLVASDPTVIDLRMRALSTGAQVAMSTGTSTHSFSFAIFGRN